MHAVESMALEWAKDELEETIEANDYIKNILQAVGRKNDPYLFKKWAGGSLNVRGGKSGTAYAKISAAAVLMDDADRFDLNIGGTTTGKKRKIGEGNPIKLLLDRLTGRFGDYKFFANSSPKAEGESLIMPAYEKTDKNMFKVPCPRCAHKMFWEFDNLVFPHAEYILTEEPYILCENTDCNHQIYERDKYKVLNQAEYEPTDDALDPLVKGFRVSSLYSMLGYSFTQYANDWLSASKTYDTTGDDSEKIRHRNTKQADQWKRKVGKSVKHSPLFNSRENLDPVPENCTILCAGVDVQDNRLECLVKGYGEFDTYFVDHIKFAGDYRIKYRMEGSPWNALAEFILTKKYKNSFGAEQPIMSAAIDLNPGKESQKDFIQKFQPLYFQQLFGVFGKGLTSKSINFVQNATTDPDDFKSWALNVNIQKKILYSKLEGHISGNSGLHFSDRPCFTEKWFMQLTVEREDEHGVFKKPHDHSRNEALDCSNYADASFLLSLGEAQSYNWEEYKKWNATGGVQTVMRNAVEVIDEGLKL